MGILLDLLKEKKVLVSDGAWGTMLHAKGLTSNDCPEEWNVSHATEVQSVAAAYAEAGSDLVLTNTFGGSRLKLKKFGHDEKVAEFNAAGARNSLAAAQDAVIAGSVGPTGEFLAPLGATTAEQMEEIFSEQIKAMLDGGLRVICVETMMALDEAVCAVRAARKLDSSIDIIATMTFDSTPGGFRTMMGVSPEQAVAGLVEAGADVVGSNCGNGTEAMIGVAGDFRKYTDKPILIHANAGVPELIDGKTCFREGPEDMAGRIAELVDAGATIVGGCCGTTPEHIKAIRAVVDSL